MKAVIVIDVDEYAIGREVNYISVQGGGMSYIVGTMGEDVRLRPLPERKDEGSVLKPLPLEVYTFRYGFNECLDEIIGETE